MVVIDTRIIRVDQTAQFLINAEATSETSAVAIAEHNLYDIDQLRQTYLFIHRTLGNRYWLEVSMYKAFSKKIKLIVITLGAVFLLVVFSFYIYIMRLVS